jgi:flagellar biosynthesis protein FlhB
MYKFSHLFDDVLSILFCIICSYCYFWTSSSSLYATVGGKNQPPVATHEHICHIILNHRCLFPLSLLFCKKVSCFFIINSRELLTGGSSN